MQRRDVLKTGAALAATALVPALRAAETSKMIGIQMEVGPIHERGAGRVLDDIQTRARVNTVFLRSFGYTDTRSGMTKPGFHGGSFAMVHPQYYKDVPVSVTDLRAPDLGNYDLLADFIPEAQKRGVKTYCWVIEDNFRPPFAGFEQMWERDLYGNIGSRHPAQGCLNNPFYRNFVLGLMEDYARSYAIDGVMWGAERQGPLGNSLGAFHNGAHTDPGKVTCFCAYCQEKARQQGISVERAKQGYMALEKYVRAGRAGERPRDGYFVAFWRILLNYPEILAWEMLWTRSMREQYAAIYQRVKSVNPKLQVGWHIWHNISFSPFYRAEQDYAELAHYSDFIKPVLYNNCAGDRTLTYMDSVRQNVFGDLSKAQLLDFQYAVMDYKEAPLDRLSAAGLSADYVYRETKRAIVDVAGTSTVIWPGIDIDIPTPDARCTPQSVEQAVRAAFRAGAPGVLLSRSYSEMKPENLNGVGNALA